MPDHKANYDRQDRGLQLLATELKGFCVPSKAEKKQLLDLMGISKRFHQTFDAVRLHVPTISNVVNAKDFDLLEIKTTDKYLPSLPKGFFFGMTENEEMLLKVFEGKYLLCLVCVNAKSTGYALVGWEELQSLTQNKRVQYQINLVSRNKRGSKNNET